PNTASYGGFAGTFDSYASGLYPIDLALQGASVGMSQILPHNGGVGQPYNLFTLPPNKMSTFRHWTITPPYYSALIMIEVMEEEGSQVMDLLLNGNSTHTPGYAVYNDGQPIRLALFNYITDPSGANDAQCQLPQQPAGREGQVPQHLDWLDRTSSTLLGTAEPRVINSAPTAACKAKSRPKLSNATPDYVDPVESTETWPTSIATKLGGTAVVEPSILATSNERGAAQEAFNIGGTSSGSQVYASAAQRSVFVSGALARVVAMVVGVGLFLVDERV
ncbi:hypothetical protein FRC00_014373, partial [Tulasnella sp. 408]